MGLAVDVAEKVALARELFAAFERGGTSAILHLLHPDVRAHPSIEGAPWLEGRDAVEAFWNDAARASNELEARPLDFELHGDTVIVRGYLRRRDGRTLSESQTFWLYEIHDGLITRMEAHPSRASALAAAV